jgi:FMN reductase
MDVCHATDQPGPLVVGIGGSGRPGSTTERALTVALAGAEQAGARTSLFDGAFLAELPLYVPWQRARAACAVELLDALVSADGVILATPSYHGGVSALVKNALDYLEDLRDDHRPYLDGRAVGCVVTAAGWQTGGTTLSSLWSIVHALRGWPTPLSVTLNTTRQPLDPAGSPDAARSLAKLSIVGQQVARFAAVFGQAPERAGGKQALPAGVAR